MQLPKPDIPTIIAIAVTVYAGSTMLHELGHAIAALAVGGKPSLISSTDVRGDFSSVSRAGIVLIGLSGSLSNLLLALGGLLLLKSVWEKSSATAYFLWLLITVNGFVLSTYMIISPLFDFGDWATMIRRFEWQLPLRLGVAGSGGVLTYLCFRLSVHLFVPFLTTCEPENREERARKYAVTSWLAGTGVAVIASLFSPLGLQWALMIAIGSSMGTTWLILPVARFATQQTEQIEAPCFESITLHRIWLLTSIVIGALFVFVFGPGIRL